jgi:hypothetical protein
LLSSKFCLDDASNLLPNEPAGLKKISASRYSRRAFYLPTFMSNSLAGKCRDSRTDIDLVYNLCLATTFACPWAKIYHIALGRLLPFLYLSDVAYLKGVLKTCILVKATQSPSVRIELLTLRTLYGAEEWLQACQSICFVVPLLKFHFVRY